MKVVVLALCSLPLWSQTVSGPVTVNISSTVKQSAVKRFGINLSFLTFWDSGQMMKNLVYRNPGFEPAMYQSVMRCATGTSTSCTDDSPWSTWTSGFWNGASYEIVRAGAQIRTGTVASYTGPSGSTGSYYQFNTSGVSPATGDLIILRKQFTGGSTYGWAVNGVNGGTTLDETVDLPPGLPGKQCVRMVAPSAGQSVALTAYFDSTPGRAFVALNGPHQITFYAKGVGGNNQLNVALNRSGQPFLANSTLTIGTSWQPYTISFTGNDTGAASGTLQLQFTASSSSVLLDDVSLMAVNTDPTNTTVFRDPVVTALKTLNPGVLRYWGSQLGDSLDNQISPVWGRLPSGFSAFSSTPRDLAYGLHEFLQLAQTVGAEPWYVVPPVTDPSEAANLIEYLAGDSNTPYGAKRAALGQVAPWTSVFPMIHLEFGNEAWNSLFKGGTIEYPDAYGERAQAIFGAMRAYPAFVASHFDLVLGGQFDDVGRTVANNTYCNNHDTIDVAPYISSALNTYDSNEDLFGPLFAEPQYDTSQGYLAQEFSQITASARPVPMAVYETNLGTVGGTIPQSILDQFTPSLGAGVAMASHMLNMLQTMGIRTQNLYALPQYTFQTSDGELARLWGSVVDMGVTNLKRPQFLALQLINQALFGDMLTTSFSSNAPTWNQPLVNGVQLAGANYLQAFAFVQGTQNALVLINLSRSTALPVNFTGTNVPSGSVLYQSLQGSAPTLTNENGQNVSISSQALTGFSPTAAFSLPPYSVNVLSWSGGTSTPPVTPPSNPTPPPPTTPAIVISSISVSSITNWGATVNWTTNVPTTTSVQYGTTTAYGSLTPATSYLTTSHSILISGLANATAYDAQILAVDGSGNLVKSANITFTTLDKIPPAISQISASPGTNMVTITWMTDKASDSQVEYGSTAAYGSLSALNSTLTTSHSVTISGLTPGVYHYAVMSRDASGNLGVSVDVTVTIAGSTAASIAIEYLSAWNITGSTATITWSTAVLADTEVYFGTNASLAGAQFYQLTTLTENHQANLTNLIGGTIYYYRVVSRDAQGDTGTSATLSFVTPRTRGPVISNVAITITGSGTAQVTWTTDEPATGQVQYGATTGYGMWSQWYSALTTTHSATLQWLPIGTDNLIIMSTDGSGLNTTSPNYAFTVPN